MPPALALGVSLAVALTAWRAHALTASGAVTAALIGFAVLWSNGWPGGAVLAMFFLPSSLIGRWAQQRFPPGASDARGERRDAVQVTANGAAAALGALLALRAGGLGFWILTGALAAAAADTWATSLGAWSPRDPRHLLSGARVPCGTSGGVSLVGTLGGVAGALLVAGTAALLAGSPALLLAGFGIGVGGMFLDSLLGAAVQGRYRCPACGTPSERRRHLCGAPTQLVGGWRWLDNDAVNAVATTAAGLAAGLLWFWH
ncbi:MAG TPA: DUF92 domain-containing protein [Gemmatimonadales bacterium]|jgi:uncharacterized protein (TIGR00297 family)|nr:DUF92 domain-containing protein [Gemmatimonadales bacterium]